jgi:hypothetical protein
MEASLAWATAMAVAVAASPGWAGALAMEAVDIALVMDLAGAFLPAVADMDSLDSTKVFADPQILCLHALCPYVSVMQMLFSL